MALTRRRMLAVALTAVAAALAWFAARHELTLLVGRVARALALLAGWEPWDAPPDTLALVVARTAEGALVRGTTLERWHVNLIAVPVLAAVCAPGRRGAVALALVGAALVVVCDAAAALAFVALQGWGAAGEPSAVVDPAQRQAIRALAMRGLAVYAAKLVPLVVFGLLLVGWPKPLADPEES